MSNLETARPETQATGQSDLQEGLAKRAETNALVAKARENLGEVASKLMVTASGEVVTQKDLEEERRVREAQGHGYQR